MTTRISKSICMVIFLLSMMAALSWMEAGVYETQESNALATADDKTEENEKWMLDFEKEGRTCANSIPDEESRLLPSYLAWWKEVGDGTLFYVADAKIIGITGGYRLMYCSVIWSGALWSERGTQRLLVYGCRDKLVGGYYLGGPYDATAFHIRDNVLEIALEKDGIDRLSFDSGIPIHSQLGEFTFDSWN